MDSLKFSLSTFVRLLNKHSFYMLSDWLLVCCLVIHNVYTIIFIGNRLARKNGKYIKGFPYTKDKETAATGKRVKTYFVKSVDTLIRHLQITNCHNEGMKLPNDRIRIVTCQFIFLLTWHDTTLWFINNFPYRHSSVFFQGFNQLG